MTFIVKLFGKRKSGKDWFEQGNDLYEKESFLEAIECFDKVILDKKMHGKNIAMALINKGKCIEKLEDLETALKCYDWAINMDSKSSEAYLRKAVILKKIGQHKEAKEFISKSKSLEE